MKKRQILIYILLVIVLAGTLTFSYYNYTSTKKFVLNSVERETNELLNNFSTEVNRFSMERVAEIQLMAEHIPYLMENDEDIIQFLSQQNDNMPYFTGLGFITPEGKVRAADGTTFPVKQRESFERAYKGSTVFSNIFELKQDPDQKVTAISTPVRKADGEIIGVLSGVMNLGSLISELVEESSLPGTVFLLKDQEVLFSSNYRRPFHKVIPESEKLIAEVDNKHSGRWNDSEDPLRFIVYKHAHNNWVVLVDSSTNPATDKIADTLLSSILLDASVIIIILIICLYLNNLHRRQQIQYKFDRLTGLGNRLLLEENLTRRLAQSRDRRGTLYSIRIDRFTELTERFGYQIGGQILFIISRRLLEQPSKIQVYRTSNEEFAVTAYMDTENERNLYAKMLLEAIEEPIYTGLEELLAVTASIGIREFVVGDDAESIIQDGVYANLEAGKRGGNQYVFFTEQLAKESAHFRTMANNLAHALENEEFYLLYQPIYSIEKDRIVSFETLMRWKSPTLGEVGPFHFIPLLEESDAIIDVGRWLIRQVANQVLRWEADGYDHFAVTLNVSIKQLQHEDFLSDVQTILEETGVSPERLVFEVTESIVAQNVEEAADILRTLNAMGIKTALDDFGTGYSSLSILKSFPFQYMKIDRAFILEVLSDEGQSEAILRSIIQIADSLQLTTIMEGVETLDQLNIMKRLGARRIQGYFFSKPIPPQEAAAFLKKERLLETMTDQ